MTAQITQVIGLLPPAPNPAADTPTQFSEKAAASVAAQQLLPPEINTWRTQANALAIEVNEFADDAAEAAALAVPAAVTAVAAKDISVALKPTTSASPPASPIAGSQWVSSDTGRHYLWYVDTDGGQWVELGGLVVDNATAVTVLAADLAAESGSSLSGFKSSMTGATSRTTEEKLRDIVSVEDFFIAAEADAAPMFNRAGLSSAKAVHAFGRTYAVGSTPIIIRTGQCWNLAGATFTTSSSTATVFSATGVDDWSMIGPFLILGAAAGVGTAKAIHITGCKRWRVDGGTARRMKGWGMKVDPGSPSSALRGDQGQIVSFQTHENHIGFENTSGTGSEYCTLSGVMASGNTHAVIIAAGNTTLVGGNIVDNTHGLYVGPGSNHAHGIAVGVNINHNAVYNVKVEDVTYGHSFVGCHFYGDDAVGAGEIWLKDSKAVRFTDCVINAKIRNDGTTGPNYITNCMFPAGNTSKGGTQPGMLYVSRCVTMTGPSNLNDAAQVFSLAYRSTNQTLTAGATVAAIMDGESADNRAAYNNITGVFTVPSPATQIYDVDVFYTITAASGLTTAGSLVEVRNAGVAAGYIPIVAVSGTQALAAGRVVMAAGNAAQITVVVTVNSGAVSPVLSSSISKQTIRLAS